MLVYEAGPITVRELEEKDEWSLASWLSNPDVLQYYEDGTILTTWSGCGSISMWMMTRLAALSIMREADRVYPVLSSR